MTADSSFRRAVAVIDGEHYPSVVREALEELPDLVVAAVLVGGIEKLRGGEDYGVPLSPTLEQAIREHEPDVILDLSDEPVLGPADRLALAGRALAAGVPYEGADFRFDPPRPRAHVAADPRHRRDGQTGRQDRRHGTRGASSGEAPRGRRARDGTGRAVASGARAGRPSIDGLLALSRDGRHAASDHLETAIVAAVRTIGCRRCGGGLAGAVGTSNVHEGLVLAEALAPEMLVLDGSGAALPPIAADRTILVVGAHQGASLAGGYLNGYRALLADLVLVTMAEGESSPR